MVPTDIPTYIHRTASSLVQVRGRDRVDLLHRLSTNDLRPLSAVQRHVSTLFTTNQGKLVDWTWVLSLPDALWVRTSAGRAAALTAWIDKYVIMEDVQCADVSADWAFCAVTGPAAASVAGLAELPAPGVVVLHEGGVWLRGLSAYGPRLEGILPAAAVPGQWAAWQERGGRVWDDAAAEVARLLAGVPSHAHEFADEVNPLELRLTAHAVGWNKGCYIGQEVISRLDSYDKVARLLMGFETDAPVMAAPGGAGLKLTRDGRPLGRVTSVAPVGQGSVGLAIVKKEAAQAGEAMIEGPQGGVAARLVMRPFFTP